MTERVQPVEMLDTWFAKRMADVHTALPGKILSYDAAAQTVDVEPQISRIVFNADGDRTIEELDTLYDVPVAFPRGGGFHISLPLAAGDFVLVIFSEEPTIVWRQQGSKARPGFLDRHGLNGAFAVPCGFPDKNKLSSAPSSTDLVIASDDGSSAVVIKPSGEVRIGDATAANYAALANLVDTLFTTIDTVFRSGWTPVAMDGGAALKTAWLAALSSPPSSVAASKTKVK